MKDEGGEFSSSISSPFSPLSAKHFCSFKVPRSQEWQGPRASASLRPCGLRCPRCVVGPCVRTRRAMRWPCAGISPQPAPRTGTPGGMAAGGVTPAPRAGTPGGMAAGGVTPAPRAGTPGGMAAGGVTPAPHAGTPGGMAAGGIAATFT